MMNFRSVFAITLICLLAFCVASPGRNAKIRAERKKQEQQNSIIGEQQHEEVKYKGKIELDNGIGEQAFLAGALSRYDYQTEKQTYIFIVNEISKKGLVRQSACRVATKAIESPVYSGRAGCIDTTYARTDTNDGYEILQSRLNSLESRARDMSTPTNDRLSVKIIIGELNLIEVGFRFNRGRKFSDTKIFVPEQWECKQRTERFQYCYFESPGKDVALITPYEWHE